MKKMVYTNKRKLLTPVLEIMSLQSFNTRISIYKSSVFWWL